MRTFVFIDSEYAFTCAVREGQHPNYRNIITMFDSLYGKSLKIAYHVGSNEKKKGVYDFLNKIGIDYNVILNYQYASKTQMVGASMAIDVMKMYCENKGEKNNYVFLTADDYLIPIVEELYKMDQNIDVFYFNAIFSRELDITCKAIKIIPKLLNNRYFIYPKAK